MILHPGSPAIRPTADDLNAAVDFDQVFRVHPDGSITDEVGVYGPDILLPLDADGYYLPDHDDDALAQAGAQGWGLMRGYTGQYGARMSPLMHASEYLGGRMADDVLSAPGLYVIVAIYSMRDEPDAETEVDNWAVAYREDAA